MKNKKNLIPSAQQNTKDIEGYYFEGKDRSQIAYWTCFSDQVSNKHYNQFDEYMVCIAGQYTAYVEDIETILNPGDELVIPKNKMQWRKAIKGTRTIHVFSGQRIK